jgi:uncharacterized protein involved in outer membrane biogenesis
MTGRRRWILLPLAALGAGLIALIVLFDSNWLKGPIEGLASAALERDFEVADIDVDLAAAPTVTLGRVRVANADWGSRPDMLRIAQVRFAIELWPLLQGDIRLPFVRVQEPDLLLETNRAGLANWKLGEQDQPEAPPAIPIIRDLEITGAAIRHRAPDRPEDVVAALETVEGALGEVGPGVQLRARGTLERQPLSLALAAAPLAELKAEGERYPFRLDGRLGQSDIHGRVMVDRDRPEPLITVNLTSDQIRLEDLEPLLPVRSGQAAAAPEAAVDAALADAGQTLEGAGDDARLDRGLLPGIDLDLSYAVSSLTGSGLALSDLHVAAQLEDGAPRLELVGGGQYRNAPVELDVQVGQPAEGATDTRAYPVDALIKAAGSEIQVEGEIGKPATFDGLDLQVRMMSDDLNELLALADL